MQVLAFGLILQARSFGDRQAVISRCCFYAQVVAVAVVVAAALRRMLFVLLFPYQLKHVHTGLVS